MNRVNQIAIDKIRHWLDEENKSIQWLAKEIGISKSLMGHILTGERQFLPERMSQVAKVMGISVEELLSKESEEEKAYTLSLRGKADSRAAKRHLNNMLFAIEDSLRIEEMNSAKD
ncbi:helix-turn-helix domain-containing protein [Aquibacillus albus]|uniref:Transcriptional regulator with XRE-family HTH domain n=1 Tax=Aquibacillus albus TaxID=1168171 RepID=A0ABS2N479_9BACI|nr:helix-turn-helix transcriptional regulator [Aquibacillus albus]MBM7572927.1 transcriptional regulator with XRE-family HTH domain [Aquibacillus albus]